MLPEILLYDADRHHWLHFTDPVDQISATQPDAVPDVLRHIETRVEEEKLHAVGFLTYEAAEAFDPACSVHKAGKLPLAWFGLFQTPHVISSPTPSSGEDPLTWTPAWLEEQFTAAVRQVHAAIASGETYQVNLTFPMTTPFTGDPRTFFDRLVHGQRAAYATYIDLGEQVICSVSPELFFDKNGDQLTMRPMKGTIARSMTAGQDRQQQHKLATSAKDRAENIMILDMVRNDLGRLAKPGQVTTQQICSLEKYPTVWQMTSTVTATTSASLGEIMQALFPCASITGAPKFRTMQVIKHLEPTPREIYTGGIGHVAPGGRARFSVAIRTALIDRKEQQAVYGVGAGITWDSSPADEYRECLHKARVLSHHIPVFSLLETLLWQPAEGFWLLREHLDRLSESADYFGMPCDPTAITTQLQHCATHFQQHPCKIRLLLDSQGQFLHQVSPVPSEATEPVRLGLAVEPIDPTNPFLYHKTTERSVYASARALRPDCEDVILWNPSGELTETTIANLVFSLNGELVTPPVSCGLLAGTFRAHLLASGKIREKTINRDDLQHCQRIFLINSLRGWREGTLTLR